MDCYIMGSNMMTYKLVFTIILNIEFGFLLVHSALEFGDVNAAQFGLPSLIMSSC